MVEINKLPEQVVNQIAAGEVIERPASVLKELMENAIDSGADSIEIFIEQGGIRRIEVRDNGKGILKDDLSNVFSRYATSKLKNIADLDTINSYGFRGEALASIGAVSYSKITSARDIEAYSIEIRDGKQNEIKPASRGQGTTVTIQNLFESLPARQKFLKKPETEYRYILEIFQYFALLNGTVHFRLIHNNKEIYNLPKSDKNLFPVERVSKVFKIEKENLIEVYHKEYGIECIGVIIHPKLLGSRAKMLLQYVNSRPVNDKGIVRAMQQGISEFVPDFYKVAGILGLFLPSDQVDVNVHPRKMEVKFLNPYRIFSAVTHSIKQAVASKVQKDNLRPIVSEHSSMENSKIWQESRGNNSQTPQSGSYIQDTSGYWEKKEDNAYSRLRSSQPSFLGTGVADNLNWTYGNENNSTTSSQFMPKFELERVLDELDSFQIVPALGRYIIAILKDEIWMIDQHAAAERIRFEQFQAAYIEHNNLEVQTLLAPISIPLSEQENEVITQHLELFESLGFELALDNEKANIVAVPVALQKGDIELLIRDTISQLLEHVDLFDNPVIADFVSEKDISLAIATMACHNSVRMNQRLSLPEAKSILSDLLKCKVPYACPHGRRAIWRLKQEEIDKQFMRT